MVRTKWSGWRREDQIRGSLEVGGHEISRMIQQLPPRHRRIYKFLQRASPDGLLPFWVFRLQVKEELDMEFRTFMAGIIDLAYGEVLRISEYSGPHMVGLHLDDRPESWDLGHIAN